MTLYWKPVYIYPNSYTDIVRAVYLHFGHDNPTGFNYFMLRIADGSLLRHTGWYLENVEWVCDDQKILIGDDYE